MNEAEMKQVQKKKNTDYNVYSLDKKTFYLFYGCAAALILDSVLQMMTPDWKGISKAFAFLVILLAGAGVGFLLGRRGRTRIEPYQRGEGFEFLGLYDTASSETFHGRDVLSRENEAAYIKQTLENLIFPQNRIKQALCLTGASGCGKSTILSFFRRMCADQYEIYDLTGNYVNFQAILEEYFGQNIDKELLLRTQQNKLVFILDQFERFFFLSEEKKEQIRNLIQTISRKNTAVIVSLREEYLAAFMKEFDVNDMKKKGGKDRLDEKSGIMNNLISTIRDLERNYHIATNKKKSFTFYWKNSVVKDNQFIHLEHAGGPLEDTMLEKVGDTIFFCENQNDIHVQSNAILETSGILQGRCEILFGDSGREFFEKHKKETLIEQQIIYHMAEYEKKKKKISANDLKQLLQMEDYELLNTYFDIQLTSTGDYYNASRLLYLLSTARLNHVVMKMDDLVYGMFANQFRPDGYQQVPRLMDRLEELQLIKKNIRHSDLEYEIAHDFIAQAFLNYSSSNLDRNVKGALDIYMSEYLDVSKVNNMKEKRRFFDGLQTANYYKWFTLGTAFALVLVHVAVFYIFNPWQEILQGMNVFGEYKSFFTLLIDEACILYLYNIYQKAFRYHRGKKASACKVVYAVLMVGAICALICYPHGMLMIGILLAIMGFNGAFLLDAGYQKACRRELRNYGLKCAMIGIAFAVFHIILCVFVRPFPLYIIFFEMAMLCILVGYAYMAHMTREYLYGRAMDACSEQINGR